MPIMNLCLRYKVWLENESGKPIVGEGRLKIFHEIRRTGSILKAAKALGLPYRNVWAKVKDAERQCGFKIVETTRHGSTLTLEGLELLHKYDSLQRSCSRSAKEKFKKLFPKDNSSDATSNNDRGRTGPSED